MTFFRKVLAYFFIVAGILFILLGIVAPDGTDTYAEGKKAVIIIGMVAIIAGLSIRFYAPMRKDRFAIKHGKPGEYSTKMCPACYKTIALEAQFCEHCGKKQCEGASTCCGNEELTETQARSFFAGERANARKVGSTHYIWRSIRDGARCERCANNDSHVFSWDEEPPGGHAGARARCRCYPEAILPKR